MTSRIPSLLHLPPFFISRLAVILALLLVVAHPALAQDVTYSTGQTAAGTITNNVPDTLTFESDASTGSAVITNNSGLYFTGTSTATGTALTNGTTGTIDLSAHNGSLAIGSLGGSGTVLLGANNLAVGALGVANVNLSFGGAISGTGGSLTKTGPGYVTLTGANTYTGGTTVSSGTLRVNAAAGTGGTLGTGNVSVASGAYLYLRGDYVAPGFAISNVGNVFFTDTASAGSAAITSSNALIFYDSSSAGSATITNTATGSLNFQNTSTAGSAVVTNNHFMTVSATASAGSATITNYGSLNFYGPSIGAATVVNNSSLAFFDGVGTATGTSTVTNNASLFFLNSGTAPTTAVTNGATGGIALFALTAPGAAIGSLAGGGTVDLSSKTLTVGALNTSTTYSGAITGAGSFVKTGTGTLTLAGAATYTGTTTVDAGTLVLSATGTLANTSVITVNDGATFDVSAQPGFTLGIGKTLGGAGSIEGLVTISSGAHLAPGNSPGALTFNDGLTLSNGAILDFALGTASDTIRVSGGTLTGPASGTITINLSDSGDFTAGTYDFIDASGATLTSIDGTSFELGTVIAGYDFTFVQSGNLFQLVAVTTAVPEPSTCAIIASFACLALAAWRKRRRG